MKGGSVCATVRILTHEGPVSSIILKCAQHYFPKKPLMIRCDRRPPLAIRTLNFPCISLFQQGCQQVSTPAHILTKTVFTTMKYVLWLPKKPFNVKVKKQQTVFIIARKGLLTPTPFRRGSSLPRRSRAVANCARTQQHVHNYHIKRVTMEMVSALSQSSKIHKYMNAYAKSALFENRWLTLFSFFFFQFQVR